MGHWADLSDKAELIILYTTASLSFCGCCFIITSYCKFANVRASAPRHREHGSRAAHLIARWFSKLEPAADCARGRLCLLLAQLRRAAFKLVRNLAISDLGIAASVACFPSHPKNSVCVAQATIQVRGSRARV